MKYLSVCSGIEAATEAWRPLGWEAVGFSEIEPFPCAVLASHYPDVKNYGDLTKHEEWDIKPGTVDVLIGGTPCFSETTLILSRRGLIPICDVVIGDDVWTHKNRWRKVVATGNKRSSTLILKGQGLSSGIETTQDHPFYSRIKTPIWDNSLRRYIRPMSEAEWTPANLMVGRFWASPSSFELSEPPPIEGSGRESVIPVIDEHLAWIMGRWLGDGWCRINQRRGYVLICCSKKERGDVDRILTATGLRYSVVEEKTTFRYQIASRAFARWLDLNFGHGAEHKTIPAWILGWHHRKAFLDGYISADGCNTPNGYRISTVSKRVAIGITMLSQACGFSVSQRLVVPTRKHCIIQGRTVSEQEYYQISLYHKSRSSVDLDGHRWGLVRKVSAGTEKRVFNLEVQEDNSYVADGIVVHNCQSFSVAGLRKGLADPRGNLALVYLALVDRIRPRWVVWENVPGVLSSNGGRDFGAFIGALGELGYGFSWRILDAQYWGIAQQRRRVFVVGCLDGWQRAASVLFEREGCTWYYPPRRSLESELTPPPTIRPAFDNKARCITRGGNCRLDFKTEDFVIVNGNDVRRLTPTECEQLMGFPVGYTDIKYKNKPALDIRRYHTLGNSMAVPVIRWIGERIEAVDNIGDNP